MQATDILQTTGGVREISSFLKLQAEQAVYANAMIQDGVLTRVIDPTQNNVLQVGLATILHRPRQEPVLVLPWLGMREASTSRGLEINTAKEVIFNQSEITSAYKPDVPPQFQQIFPLRKALYTHLSSRVVEKFFYQLAKMSHFIRIQLLKKEAEQIEHYCRKKFHLPFSTTIYPWGRSLVFLKIPIGSGSAKTATLALDLFGNTLLACLKSKRNGGSSPKIMMNETKVVWNISEKVGIIPTYVNQIVTSSNGCLRQLLIQPFCANGDLFDLLYNFPDKLTPKISLQILYDVSRALEAIHAEGWTHCDIKPENVLISDEFRAFLTDLAFVTRSNSTKDVSFQGTMYLLSPEIFQQLLAKEPDRLTFTNPARDIWALGIIFYNVLYKKSPPWTTVISEFQSNCEVFSDDILQKVNNLFKGIHPYPEPHKNKLLDHLTWEMFSTNPEQRPSAKYIVQQLEEAAKKIEAAL